MSSEEWKKHKIKDILINVIDNRGKNPPFSDDGYPYIDTTCIVGDNRHPDYSLIRKYISTPTYNSWFRSGHPIKDDVLIATVGANIGKICLMDSTQACIAQNTVGLRINKELADPVYIYYVLSSAEIQAYLKSLDIGSAQPSIKVPHLLNVLLTLPKLTAQRRIAEILSALDDKIELNRQTNATLEAIAQAIFKEWFVDFNFPGATGEMVESELGMIPKGWKVLPLDEIADFLNGLALQKFPPENEEDYLPVIKIRELKNGVTDSSDRASSNLPEKYIIHDGDLLFSWSGSLELKFWVGGNGALNQHLFKVTSNSYPLWFCYLWIFYHLESFRNIAEEKTTTIGHIKREHLSSALCLIPNCFDILNDVINPIFSMVIENRKENTSLTLTRDHLLPVLMNGEIEV